MKRCAAPIPVVLVLLVTSSCGAAVVDRL